MDCPNEINCSEQVFDISLHGSKDLLAAALIDGSTEIHRYGTEDDNTCLAKLNNHTAACRCALFSTSGERLYTASTDKSILCYDGVGQLIGKVPDAHDSAINRMIDIDDHTIVTGDDAGCVKIWDMRQSKSVAKFSMHEDFVSSLCYDQDRGYLLSSGGDSTLCAYDLKSNKNNERSDEQESEINCVEIMKGGQKVICGTQDGTILIFSWGRWGDCNDRYPGHPETVDCMLRVDESTVVTGSSDGLLRVVSLLPNKVLGVVGDHQDFPVEGMRFSRDRKFICSFAHDEIIRSWDISVLNEADAADTNEMEMDEGASSKPKSSFDSDSSDEDEGADGMDQDNDSDDSDSEDDTTTGNKELHIPTASEKFFADM